MYFPQSSQREPFKTFPNPIMPLFKALQCPSITLWKKTLKGHTYKLRHDLPVITSLPCVLCSVLHTLPLCALYVPTLDPLPCYSFCLENLSPDNWWPFPHVFRTLLQCLRKRYLFLFPCLNVHTYTSLFLYLPNHFILLFYFILFFNLFYALLHDNCGLATSFCLPSRV